jgi:hypothetical protein
MQRAFTGLDINEVFTSEDMDKMQNAFDAAVRRLDGVRADSISHHAIASVIVQHYALGLRDRHALMQSAVDAARGAHGETPLGAIVWRSQRETAMTAA